LISTYKLSTPIIYDEYIIDLIEIPSPKDIRDKRQGFEHFEFVIDQPFDHLIKLFPQCSFQYSKNNSINPDAKIKLKNGTVKFHHKSLEHIINIEKKESIANFLSESKILHLFDHYHPCISGTFPLDLEVDKSDLDIIFSSNDLHQFINETDNHFNSYPNYKKSFFNYQNETSAVVNFDYHDLPVELFCQTKTTFQQQANLHFLIEGRLLKIFGNHLKRKILHLKKQGMKTEPAFGEVLNLNNPYQDLLEIGHLTDYQLLMKYPHLKG